MDIQFCEHGNVIGLQCSECNPKFSSKNAIEEGIDCPVSGLSDAHCENEGVRKREHSEKQFVLECTSCGWEWRRWKGNGKDLPGTMPKMVICSICNKISFEKETRKSDASCSTCGRTWFRENKSHLVRD